MMYTKAIESIKFLFPVIILSLLAIFMSPSWMTNDDPAMSMISHGYGSIDSPSSQVYFSNIYWGKIIQIIPSIGGWHGYSIATYLTLIISLSVAWAAISDGRTSLWLSVSIIICILLYPTLFPQFTLTAGTAACAAVLSLKRYTDSFKLTWLFLAVILAGLSFLIRSLEMLFVCLVALPLINWKILLVRKSSWVAGCIFIVFISTTTIMNKSAYEDPSWDFFNTNIGTIQQITGWSYADILINDKGLLKKHSLSAIDVEMANRWMWFDIDQTKFDNIQNAIDEINAKHSLSIGWQERVLESLVVLASKDIVFLSLFAVIAIINKKSKALLISWLLFIGTVAIIGAFGRPGEIRIYIPVISLLLMSSVFYENKPNALMSGLTLILGTSFTFLHASTLMNQSIQREKSHQTMLVKLENLPKDEYVAGYYSTIKANHVFALKESANLSSQFNNLYLFGWPAIFPNSVSYQAEKKGIGFKSKLLSEEGVWIVINSTKLLERYCQANKLKFETLLKRSKETGHARKIRCTSITNNTFDQK